MGKLGEPLRPGGLPAVPRRVVAGRGDLSFVELAAGIAAGEEGAGRGETGGVRGERRGGLAVRVVLVEEV